MKERLKNAIYFAIVIAIGITFVSFLNRDTFSFFKTTLYALVAFAVHYIGSFLSKKIKRKK